MVIARITAANVALQTEHKNSDTEYKELRNHNCKREKNKQDKHHQ